MKGWENVSGIVINSEIDTFVALGGWEVFCCWDTTGVSSLQLISTHARAREVVVASYSNIVSGMALLMSLSKLTSSTNRGRGCLQWKDLHLEDLCIILPAAHWPLPGYLKIYTNMSCPLDRTTDTIVL